MEMFLLPTINHIRVQDKKLSFAATLFLRC